MRFFLAVFFAFSTQIAQAEVLFEGYYKVSQFKKHIGFLVVRHEVDPKAKLYKTTSFMRLAKNNFDMTESLQTVSNSELAPISYSYIGTDGKKSKTIDAGFKDNKMIAFVTENGEKNKVEKKFAKGTFLSSVLYYLMLSSKSGLKTDSNYDFEAFAEEQAGTAKGNAKVDKKMVTQGTLQLLRVKNTFAGSEYENLITERGEIISASTAATGVETELVRNSEEAVQGIKISSGTLEKIFGAVPKGDVNVYSKK